MTVTLTTEQFQTLLATISQGQVPAVPTKTNPITFSEFCDSMKYINVSKLQNMTIVDFIVATIKYNFDTLEETEYPFVCSNERKRIFYHYTEEGWKKNTSFMTKLYSLIIKRAYKDLEERYTIKYDDDDDDEDEDVIEKKYTSSKHAEKQAIITNLCHSNKMNWETVCEKVLTKIAKLIKVEFNPI